MLSSLNDHKSLPAKEFDALLAKLLKDARDEWASQLPKPPEKKKAQPKKQSSSK